MKRVIQKIGSRKWYGDDFISIQNEALAATEAHFKDYGAHVLTGCVVFGTDISAGVVVIDGKACRYLGETGITFPRYLVKQETEVDAENYETGGSKPTYLEVYAVGQSTVPTGVEYVTIQSSGGVRRLMDVIRDNHDHPASAITSGVLAVARIPNLDAGKITSGTFANARISSSSVVQHLGNYVDRSTNESIFGVKNFNGIINSSSFITINDDNSEGGNAVRNNSGVKFSAENLDGFVKIATYKGANSLDIGLDITTNTILDSAIRVNPNGKISLGTVNNTYQLEVGGDIRASGNIFGSVSANNITSGTLAVARIPNLDAGKITSGTFADARISSASVVQHLGNYVDRSTNESIFGVKNFNGIINSSSFITINDDNSEGGNAVRNNSGVKFSAENLDGFVKIATYKGANSLDIGLDITTNTILDSAIRVNPNGKISLGTVNNTYQLEVGGDIRATGNVFSNSDRRLKTRIASIDGALSKALNINACYYNWKDEKHGKGRQFGLIAQEVESVLPEVVNTDENGSKVLDYAKLSALLFSALRELNTKVESLKN